LSVGSRLLSVARYTRHLAANNHVVFAHVTGGPWRPISRAQLWAIFASIVSGAGLVIAWLIALDPEFSSPGDSVYSVVGHLTRACLAAIFVQPIAIVLRVMFTHCARYPAEIRSRLAAAVDQQTGPDPRVKNTSGLRSTRLLNFLKREEDVDHVVTADVIGGNNPTSPPAVISKPQGFELEGEDNVAQWSDVSIEEQRDHPPRAAAKPARDGDGDESTDSDAEGVGHHGKQLPPWMTSVVFAFTALLCATCVYYTLHAALSFPPSVDITRDLGFVWAISLLLAIALEIIIIEPLLLIIVAIFTSRRKLAAFAQPVEVAEEPATPRTARVEDVDVDVGLQTARGNFYLSPQVQHEQLWQTLTPIRGPTAAPVTRPSRVSHLGSSRRPLFSSPQRENANAAVTAWDTQGEITGNVFMPSPIAVQGPPPSARSARPVPGTRRPLGAASPRPSMEPLPVLPPAPGVVAPLSPAASEAMPRIRAGFRDSEVSHTASMHGDLPSASMYQLPSLHQLPAVALPGGLSDDDDDKSMLSFGDTVPPPEAAREQSSAQITASAGVRPPPAMRRPLSP